MPLDSMTKLVPYQRALFQTPFRLIGRVSRVRLVVFLESIKPLAPGFEVRASESKKTRHRVDGEREDHSVKTE
jgi:hypothetical protein